MRSIACSPYRSAGITTTTGGITIGAITIGTTGTIVIGTTGTIGTIITIGTTGTIATGITGTIGTIITVGITGIIATTGTTGITTIGATTGNLVLLCQPLGWHSGRTAGAPLETGRT
jgi:hypothetical protein